MKLWIAHFTEHTINYYFFNYVWNQLLVLVCKCSQYNCVCNLGITFYMLMFLPVKYTVQLFMWATQYMSYELKRHTKTNIETSTLHINVLDMYIFFLKFTPLKNSFQCLPILEICRNFNSWVNIKYTLFRSQTWNDFSNRIVWVVALVYVCTWHLNY